MALTTIKIFPGVDKQDTNVGAQARWVDSDNARFRYGTPEKVGGWSSLLTETIVGAARKLFAFVDLEGNRYTAIGTDKFLLIYFEGQIYDITPWRSDDFGAQITFTSSTLATDSTTAKTCTITTTTPHGLEIGDIIYLDSVTLPAGTGLTNAQFEDKLFQVLSTPSTTTFTINSSNQASAVVSTGGSMTVMPYQRIGPVEQTYGYGWGIPQYGGTVSSGSQTGWGVAAAASSVTLEPGLWSFSNYGQVLIATVLNGKTFTWDTSIGSSTAFTTRASTTTPNFVTALVSGTNLGNPTASRMTLISPTTRHVIHCGTETTIGDDSSQDDMFIRFSDQEGLNEYKATAVNTAGSQRLQDGTKIMGAIKGKENILIWTDNALYTMKFVGSPFTFGFEQVGTNCGLIGQNACCEIDGVAYWMSNNGFFAFDGTVNSLPCAVEDYVYDDFDTTKGQQVCAGINNLFTEVVWYYPTSGSSFNNRYVVFNYGESGKLPMGNWYTGVNTNAIRTTWLDSLVYPKPYATAYKSSNSGSFPAVIGETGLGSSTLFQHETGTDQINADGTTTTLTSFIESYDFALQQEEPEVFLAMRRFVPNFKALTGNAKITISVKNFPSQTKTVSTLSPFTVDANTTKKDTRARGRYASIKVENAGAGESWRFGPFQVDVQPDGRR
jgi:hypothetical protein|tara:strand:+ start:48 stop:2045 length:1998 start_codon:yes stop_codon:yes gene_type:complete